jgi:hypothetical protein
MPRRSRGGRRMGGRRKGEEGGCERREGGRGMGRMERTGMLLSPCAKRAWSSCRNVRQGRAGESRRVRCYLQRVLILCEHIDDAYPACPLRKHPYPQLWVVRLVVLTQADVRERSRSAGHPNATFHHGRSKSDAKSSEGSDGGICTNLPIGV